MLSFRKSLLAVSIVGTLGIAAPTAFAGPITFASDADYSNAASQTTGVFRDLLLGDGSESLINRGMDLGGTGHTALNFTGSDNTTSPFGRATVYDLTPSTIAPTTFSGNSTTSMDILIHPFNNGKGAGLLTLFNEGVGNKGLALFLQDAGNTDTAQIRLVQQDGPTAASLSSVALGSSIAEDQWYRLTLDVGFTGSTFTITGKVFSHTIGTDPNSALGAQIGSTLTYSPGTLASQGLSDPYEIGLVARGVNATIDTSVTNFCINDCATGTTATSSTVPEPSAILLLATALFGLALRRTIQS